VDDKKLPLGKIHPTLDAGRLIADRRVAQGLTQAEPASQEPINFE
jgi:hypothetical protein